MAAYTNLIPSNILCWKESTCFIKELVWSADTNVNTIMIKWRHSAGWLCYWSLNYWTVMLYIDHLKENLVDYWILAAPVFLFLPKEKISRAKQLKAFAGGDTLLSSYIHWTAHISKTLK